MMILWCFTACIVRNFNHCPLFSRWLNVGEVFSDSSTYIRTKFSPKSRGNAFLRNFGMTLLSYTPTVATWRRNDTVIVRLSQNLNTFCCPNLIPENSVRTRETLWKLSSCRNCVWLVVARTSVWKYSRILLQFMCSVNSLCQRRGSAAACLLELRVWFPPGIIYMSPGSVLCCQIEVSASGWSLIQRIPSERGVSECDRAASKMRGPGPLEVVAPREKNTRKCREINFIL